MKLNSLYKSFTLFAVTFSLQACNGILGGIYDDPVENEGITTTGQLYIDASDWLEWHYIDLKEVAKKTAEDINYNPSSNWITYSIPTQKIENNDSKHGIFTYWYDVYGEGISKFEFHEFYPTEEQNAPESWSIAVHRNNVRTNDGAVAETDFTDISKLPVSDDYLNSLTYRKDEWNETDVWTIQDKMLLGYIGNQGININPVLSSWLKVEIPPLPPAFTINNKVFVIKFNDDSFAAVQLEKYQSSSGVKCSLTINYKYPL